MAFWIGSRRRLAETMVIQVITAARWSASIRTRGLGFLSGCCQQSSYYIELHLSSILADPSSFLYLLHFLSVHYLCSKVPVIDSFEEKFIVSIATL